MQLRNQTSSRFHHKLSPRQSLTKKKVSTLFSTQNYKHGKRIHLITIIFKIKD